MSSKEALSALTAASGVDLYATDSDGKTHWCDSPIIQPLNPSKADTITFHYQGLSYHNQHRLGSEYRLYLPLSPVTWMEIGIPASSLFKYSPMSTEKPIVIYGTAIAQKATASRPALMWTNILQRQLDAPVFYIDSTDTLRPTDARMYILDTHQPQNDSDMEHLAAAYEEKIRDVLDLHPLTDYTAVRQRREPATYEWNERHESVLQRHRTIQPDVLMIGNSIMHYWAGEPSHRIHRNVEAWNRLFEGMQVTNMGFGWDRIENVLWRIQHGELDGISPKHICLMIGTNNISIREKPEKIARGITELAEVIRRKQPQAHLHVLTVFPRKDMNADVKAVNQLLTQMLRTDECTDLIDLTPALTLPNGQIDPSLYGTDGLHPAAKGYEKVAETLKKVIFQPN